MKHISIALFTLHFSLLTLSAAVPVPWTVDMRRAQPAQFEAYQGETLDIEAALTLDGKPFEAPLNYSFFWQTNGMGRFYWEAPANGESVSPQSNGEAVSHRFNSGPTNVLFATWLPSYDVGAKVYNCFIGTPSNNYHAAFQLRLRPSPGATPNALPLPVPVIDFAKVRVLNPPWSGGGGGGGVETNAVIDIIHKTIDGSAKTLPKYLWLYETDDSYPAEAEEYYRSRGNGKTDGGCSSVRDGGFLSRNFDYPFDERAEFVVRMSAGPNRFASVGVAQVGTNLTEQMVTSGKPEYSRFYKWLPGATVDGINENGVCIEINVTATNGVENWRGNKVHCLGAVRWALDNATNAQHAAEYLAANVYVPEGLGNFHYMVADETSTYIVENGSAFPIQEGLRVTMTNFNVFDAESHGSGIERNLMLLNGANITNVWYTNAYRRETNPPWVSDLKDVIAYTNEIFNAWASHPKEYFRVKTNNGQPWWQTVHTSVYDITNLVLRVAVQETDDWYTFQVPASGGGKSVDAYTKAETDAKLAGKLGTNGTWRVSDDWEIDGIIYPASSGLVSWFFDGGCELANYAIDAQTAERANSASSADQANTAMNAGSAEFASTAGSAGSAKELKKSSISIIPVNADSNWLVTDIDHPNGFPLKPASDDISADNPHFTNEVAKVVRTLTPTPSPTLRLYDSVRHCWWVLEIVNGIPTLTVED